MPPRAPPKERALSTSVSAKEATHASAKTHHQVADTAIGVGPHQGETGTSVPPSGPTASPQGDAQDSPSGAATTYASATSPASSGIGASASDIDSPFAAMSFSVAATKVSSMSTVYQHWDLQKWFQVQVPTYAAGGR